MLRSTFQIIRGIGHQRERTLWSSGITDWKQFSEADLPVKIKQWGIETIERAEQALASGNASFFCKCMPPGEHWRIVSEFAGNMAYLDIETTGLYPRYHDTTVIGVSDGKDYKVFCRGQNLEQFADYIKDIDVIVSFNGKQFDVPFIEADLGICLNDKAHLDLRFLLSARGYRGGLKSIQQRVGLLRPGLLAHLDGRAAVWLWQQYVATGNSAYLDVLVAYNREDVIVLPALLARLVNECAAQTPFPHYCMEVPALDTTEPHSDKQLVEIVNSYRSASTFGV